MSQAGIINFTDTGGGNVVGPSSSTNNDVAVFNGTTGKIIKDSGLLYTNIVTGPASATSTDIATYNGTTGKIIEDSGIAIGLVPSSIVTDSGTGAASGGTLNINGSGGTTTSISGNNLVITSGSSAAPALAAYLFNTLTSVTGGGITYTIIWDALTTPAYNVGSWSQDGSGVWTVPATGNYLFTYNIVFNPTSNAGNTLSQVELYTSIGNYLFSSNSYATQDAFNNATMTGSVGIHLTSGSTFQWNVNVAGGTQDVSILGYQGGFWKTNFSVTQV